MNGHEACWGIACHGIGKSSLVLHVSLSGCLVSCCVSALFLCYRWCASEPNLSLRPSGMKIYVSFMNTALWKHECFFVRGKWEGGQSCLTLILTDRSNNGDVNLVFDKDDAAARNQGLQSVHLAQTVVLLSLSLTHNKTHAHTHTSRTQTLVGYYIDCLKFFVILLYLHSNKN